MRKLKKVKISFFIGSMDIGGTEKHVLHLINNLDKKRFNIELHLLYKEGKLINNVEKGIKIFTPLFSFNSKLKHPLNFLSSYFRIKKTNPDIIHCFLPHAYLFGGIIGWIQKKKVIMSRRSLNTYQTNFKFFPIKRIEKFLHSKMDLVLANSRAVEKELRGEGVIKDKLRIILNGIIPHLIPKNETEKGLFAKLGINKNFFVFLVVANFIPYKNHSMIINAVEKLIKKTKRKFKVIFVGSGSKTYEDLIKNLLAEKNLNKHVKIIKNSAEIYNFFKIAHVGISSSNEEGFSNSILEYLSFGMPVIATNVGGNPEIINKTNGFIINTNDHIQLFKKMKLLIDNHQKFKQLSIQAKLDSQKYSFKKTVKEYSLTYIDLMRNVT